MAKKAVGINRNTRKRGAKIRGGKEMGEGRKKRGVGRAKKKPPRRRVKTGGQIVNRAPSSFSSLS